MMHPPLSRAFATALVGSVLIASGCRGPLVGGELSESGQGSSSAAGGGAGSGASGGADPGDAGSMTTTGSSSTTGSTGNSTTGAGSGSGGSSSSSGSDAGTTRGGSSASGGGEGGTSGTATSGSGGDDGTGCNTCEPTEVVASTSGVLHYAKCAAMAAGVVYQGLLDTAGNGLAPDVVVRAVTLDTGATSVLSGESEAANILSADEPVLGVDDTFAYWFSRTRGDGDVMRLRRRALAGDEVENVVGINTTESELGGNPVAMAVAPGYVYWSSGKEGVFRCPTTEACNAPEHVVIGSQDPLTPLPDVLGLTVASDTLYWADTSSGEVRRKTAPSGTEDLLDTAAEPLVQICDVAFDAGSLYWILCLGTYEVRRVDTMGAEDPSSVVLATTADTLDESAGGDLFVAGDDVYFLSSDYLYQVPKDGSDEARRVALIYRSGQPRIHTILGVGVQDVYLADESGGILSVPR